MVTRYLFVNDKAGKGFNMISIPNYNPNIISQVTAPIINSVTITGQTTATIAFSSRNTADTTYSVTTIPATSTTKGISPLNISGLKEGTSYTFTITATNTTGSASVTSNSYTTFPIQPTITGITITGKTTATVAFSTTNGSDTTYLITTTPPTTTTTNNTSVVATGITTGNYRYSNISGLTENTSYTFTVTANNSSGQASVTSNSYTTLSNMLYTSYNSLNFNNNTPGTYISYIFAPDANILSTTSGISWSADCWIKMLNTTGNQGVFAWNNTGIGIHLYNGKISIQNGPSCNAYSIYDNNWHHICVTSVGSSTTGTSKFYIDGELKQTSNTTGPSKGSTGIRMCIGSRDYGGPNQNFTGKIAGCRYWENTVLSDAEVMYNKSHLTPQTTPSVSYVMITGTGNLVNNAILTNYGNLSNGSGKAYINNNNPVTFDTDYPPYIN